jgi:transcriptional regulator with XRE-family HTH domain
MSHRFNAKNFEAAAAAAGDTSRYAMAKRTGLSPSTITRLIKGDCQPGTETQAKILQVYALTVSQLMGDDEKQPVAA